MRHRTGRALTSLAVACGLLAAAACSAEGAPETVGGTVEPGPDAVAEAERLHQIVNESQAITDELTAIEHRVAKRCLEDEGFTVHDPMEFQESHTAAYSAGGYLSAAPLRAVPTAEAAEAWGFGVWAEFVRNPGNEDLAEELLTPEAMTAFGILDTEDMGMDTSEWDAEDDEYHAEWIEAYTGSPAVDEGIKGPEPDPEAPLGGCWLQMVETMYGEPFMVTYEGEDGEEGGQYPETHEPSPLFALGEFEDFSALLDAVRDEVDAFESCLVDAGYEGWELGESFYPPLWEYFGAMYDPDHFEEFGEEGLEVPEGPEEVPADFMGVLELERAMAVDFAACGQESGLRMAVEEAWAAMLVEAYQPIETDLVAWRDAMQGHLDNAQDYLQA
ncbi:hypothetical protein [Glycomyces algeriensis]|uniref:Uncharacterized protein n=1 Tax=Glycomyces algeriensis TaxID=256037 RepID=A0A9W6GAY2_9ACTN|nr:hypothetical protein [Glycomyces algeriensis]MDA1364692.1 hypothetical protein [Glycomyces algeriensis]MDR7350732.1 hypothetical protein [Glycomyces algeriensis]GLI43443.1 hypothetical protein GALLR39Z86_32930 [Glycomyces algeriensis]